MTIQELIEAHQEQIASLKTMQENLYSAVVDGSCLKDVMSHFAASVRNGIIRLQIECGTKHRQPEIEWRMWEGHEWESSKGKEASTLAGAYRLWAAKGREDKATVESVAAELKGDAEPTAEQADKATVDIAKGALLQAVDAKAGDL